MNAATHIHEITDDLWPDDTFSKEEDLEELKMHEQDFNNNESFAYAVIRNNIQIGSLYFYRSNKEKFDYVYTLWTDCDNNDILLYQEAKQYMFNFTYKIAYVPFEITKEEYIKTK